MIGVLAIDKPATWTSRDVVNRVQGLVRPVKVGHTGTLDPMAQGVLLLAIGPAARLVEFSHDATKSYAAKFLLGRTSDTLDTDGEVTLLDDAAMPERADLEAAVDQFLGQVTQVPPKFSAIRVAGKRAYDLARAGKDFEIPARQVQIDSIELEEYTYPEVSLTIQCGTGTYIRTLGSDLARSVGSDAVMSHLVRTRIGPVELEHCVALDSLTCAQDVEAQLLPATVLLSTMPHVTLTTPLCKQIRNGIPIAASDVARCSVVAEMQTEGNTGTVERIAAIDEHRALVAVLQLHPDRLYRSVRVFQKASDTTQPKSTSTPHSPES